ncbi:MAG: hypothetical protein WA777_15275, partial [Rhodanobacter sp.]
MPGVKKRNPKKWPYELVARRGIEALEGLRDQIVRYPVRQCGYTATRRSEEGLRHRGAVILVGWIKHLDVGQDCFKSLSLR